VTDSKRDENARMGEHAPRWCHSKLRWGLVAVAVLILGGSWLWLSRDTDPGAGFPLHQHLAGRSDRQSIY
jgi:hypothetical protein